MKYSKTQQVAKEFLRWFKYILVDMYAQAITPAENARRLGSAVFQGVRLAPKYGPSNIVHSGPVAR